MTDLCHECGFPIRPDGKCPIGHPQCQRCPDEDEIRVLCEAVRATWPQHRLERCELRRDVEIELVHRVCDGMVRRERRGTI